MKRHYLRTVVMAAMTLTPALTANAQRTVGSFTIQPKVGMTVSNMTNDPYMLAAAVPLIEHDDYTWTSDEDDYMRSMFFTGIKEKIGLIAGVEAEYQATRWLGLSAGLTYSMQGAKFNDHHDKYFIDVTNIKINLEYINIPIMANVYVVKGLALKAGIQPGFCVKHDVESDISVHVSAWEGKNVIARAGMNKFAKFDVSVPVGVSYEYNDFVIGANYNIGLTNMFSEDRVKSSHNSVWQITLGYKIGL